LGLSCLRMGPGGCLRGRWWNFLYCSGFNLANFALCLVGAELFDKFSLGILSLASVCCVGVVSSFFLDHSYSIPYNITIDQNTTQIVNGNLTVLFRHYYWVGPL
jgi:hypothetical protein